MGLGSGQRRRRRHHLDVWYPELNLGEAPAEADRPNHNFGTLAHDEADARGIRRVPVFVVSQLDEPISNAADAYLKLHLMSMRMAKPNTLNLDGIFAQLANVVWTNYGPFAVEDFTLRKADVERASTEAARFRLLYRTACRSSCRHCQRVRCG